ncbi:WD40 repeat domain-containing protein, partial [Candidatus Dependentiae bacterium]
NSAAVSANSWAIAAAQDRIEENSWAALAVVDDVLDLNSDISENSWAILALDDADKSLLTENSWAILAIENNFVSIVSSLYANSSAVVAHSASLVHFDEPVSENSWGILTDSQEIFVTSGIGKINGLGNPLAGCAYVHGDSIFSVRWSPNGTYLAIGADTDGGVDLRVLEFSQQNETLSVISGCNKLSGIDPIYSVDWHTSGNYLAVGGLQDDGYTADLRVFEFNGTTLTNLSGCAMNVGNPVQEVQWHPSGDFLAMVMDNSYGEDVKVFEFDDVSKTLSVLSGCDKLHGAGLYSLDWSFDGEYLAVGGDDGAGGYNIRVYAFDDTAKTLTAISGCNINFDTRVQAVRFEPQDRWLFAGSREKNVCVYAFNETNLTVYSNSTFVTNDDVNDIAVSSDGKFIFVAAHDGGGQNLFGLEFDPDEDSLTKISAACKTQGTDDLRSVSLRTGELYFAAGGDYSYSTDLEVYPVEHEDGGYVSLPYVNSWAIVSTNEEIYPHYAAFLANSGSVVSLDEKIFANSDAILANSSSIVHFGNLSRVNSNALVSQSWSISNLDERVFSHSSAIVAANNALQSHSSSIVFIDDLEKASSYAIQVHSSSIINLSDLPVENSNAIIAQSWSIVSLDELVGENSSALVSLDDRVDVLEPDVLENSWVILAIDDAADDIGTNSIPENSWAILSLDQRLDDVEPIIWANSYAEIAHSWSLVSLDELIKASSSSVHANSWAIVSISELAFSNSSALVELSFCRDNSWAIAALDERLDSVETLLQENSNTLIAHSGSLVYLDCLAENNSYALLTFDERENFAEEDVGDNSHAILSLDFQLLGNSPGVVHIDQRLSSLESEIAPNSSAIIAQSWAFSNLDERVDENQSAYKSIDEYMTSVDIEGQIADNSFALDKLCDNWVLNGKVEAHSDAVVAQSWAIANLNDLILSNSDALLTQSNSIAFFDQLASENSWSILDLNARVDAADQGIEDNSWAIVSLKEEEIGLSEDNSWALLNVGDSIVDFELAIAENSNAIVAHSASLIHFDDPISENSWGILANSSEVYLTRINGLGDALAGCAYVHGDAIFSIAWSPNGSYLAMGADTEGGVDLRVLEFSQQNETLTVLTGCNKLSGIDPIYSVDWHPSGNYLAVGGLQDYGYTADLRAFEFNGTTLTNLAGCAIDASGSVQELQWHPSGNFVAIAGENFISSEDVKVYEFDSEAETFSALSGCDKLHGNGFRCLDWSADGNYLAVGGEDGTGGYNIRVYSFDDSAKTLTELAGCRINFDTIVQALKWDPLGRWLFAGSQQTNVRVYAFDGSNLTVYSSATFSTNDDVNDIAVSSDGKFIFVAAHDGGGQNLFGLEFDPEADSLTKISAACKTQGTDDLRSVSLRTGEFYLAAAGDSTYSTDLEVYPVEKFYYSWPEANSWAIFEKVDCIVPFSNACTAQSWSIASIDELLKLNSNAIIAHSASIDYLNSQTIESTSNALLAQSWSLANVDEKIVENSFAVEQNSETLDAYSSAIASLDERFLSNSAAINANSWAIENLHNPLKENSWAIVAQSWSVKYTEDLVAENSWAILASEDGVSGIENQVSENSWSVLSLDGRNDVADGVIDDNSWLIVELEDVINGLEESLIDACSSSIFANSFAIPHISELLVPNSNAIAAHSWSIANLDERVTENSNVIVQVVVFTVNSWTILSLEDRTSAIEALAPTTSDAIVGHSWSVANLGERESANSNAITSFYPWADDAADLVVENSHAIVEIDILTTNSAAVISLDTRLSDVESLSETTSNAFISQSWSVANVDDRVNENSWAILASNDDFAVSTYVADLENNSFAIKKIEEDFVTFDAALTENSNAFLANSWSAVNLDEKFNVNSSAVVSQSWSLANLDEFVEQNSWSIDSTDSNVGSAEQNVLENSWAILAIEDRVGVTDNNSWAIVSTQSDVSDADTLMLSLSSALVSNSASVDYLDELSVNNSWAIVSNSKAVFVGEPVWLEECDVSSQLDHGATVRRSAWSHDGKYLMIVGYPYSGIVGRIYEYNENTCSFTELTGCRISPPYNYVNYVDWHPTDNYVLIGGDDNGGTYEVRSYEFNGTTLTELTWARADTGSLTYESGWHTSGNFFAVVGSNFTGGDDVRVYEFDDVSEEVTVLTGCAKDHGATLDDLHWSPDGNYLAVAGSTGSGSATIRVYSFCSIEKILTELTGCSVDFDSTVPVLYWHPSGSYLFAGSSQDNIRGYSFDGSGLTVMPGCDVSIDDVVFEGVFSESGRVFYIGQYYGSDGVNMRGFIFDSVAETLTEDISLRRSVGTGDVYGLALRGDDIMLIVSGETSVGSSGYRVHYGSLIDNNSWALVSLSDGINSAGTQILGNSWTIVHLDEVLNISETTSSGLVSLDAAFKQDEELLLATSDVLIAQSESIASLQARILASSSAILAHSWSLVNVDERMAFNSNSIFSNSWAIAAIGPRESVNRTTVSSNSFSIVENSWAVASLDEKVLGNSDAISSQDTEISTASQEDTTEYQLSLATIDKGRADLHFLDANMTLSYDLSIKSGHKLYFEDDVVLEGAGHKIRFGTSDSADLVVSDAKQVSVKNIFLNNFRSDKISIGTGASLKFDQGTKLELAENDDLTWTLSFIGNSTLSGAGNTLDLSGGGRLEVSSGSELLLKDILIKGVSSTNLSCADSASTIKLSNVGIIIPERLDFNEGALKIDSEAICSGGGVFSYRTSQSSTILANSKLRFDNEVTFSYDPSNSSKTLLIFTDTSSRLELDDVTVKIASGGLQLTKGTLGVLKASVVECDSSDADNGLIIGDGTLANDQWIDLRPGAKIDMQSGVFNYLNVES